MKNSFHVFLIFVLFACSSNGTKTNSQSTAKAVVKNADPYIGTYVTESFFKNDSGYDWVAVKISKVFDSAYFVSIRSRADRKKPTCSFAAEFQLLRTGELVGHHHGYSVSIRTNSAGIDILGTNNMALNYFCSGGATLEGTYVKTSTPLPAKQLDKLIYYTNLYDDRFRFEIKQTDTDLLLTPEGLKLSNSPIKQVVKGQVIGAEMGDLDVDGFPEIYLYLRNSKGDLELIAYNVNKGKSISMIAVPANFNKTAGFAEMALVENNLVRRIKTEKGFIQYQYKLIPGEALPQLVLDKTVNY